MCTYRRRAPAGPPAWIAGSPGTTIWHTPDGGHTWFAQETGQPLPRWADEGAATLVEPGTPAACAQGIRYRALLLAAGQLAAALAPGQVVVIFNDGTANGVEIKEIADVSVGGLVVGHNRGEAAIIVRYLEFIESCFLTFVKDIPNYAWNNPPSNNYIDDLVYAITPDATARYAKLKAGECQVMIAPNPADLPDMKANADINVLEQAGLNIGYYAMNNMKPPFDKKEVREAFAMAIDRDAIIKEVYQGAGQKAKNPIPPTMWSYNDAVVDDPYDPAAAKKYSTQGGVGTAAYIDSALFNRRAVGDALTAAGTATIVTNVVPIVAGFVLFGELLPSGWRAVMPFTWVS